MRLIDWLTAQGLTDAQFAALVDCDRSTVSKLKRGRHNASLELMVRVAKATDEAVMPNDLLAQIRLAPVERETAA